MPYLGVFKVNPDGDNAIDANDNWITENVRCTECGRPCGPSFMVSERCGYCRGVVSIAINGRIIPIYN